MEPDQARPEACRMASWRDLIAAFIVSDLMMGSVRWRIGAASSACSRSSRRAIDGNKRLAAIPAEI